MSRRVGLRVAVIALVAAAMTGGAAGAAYGAATDTDPQFTFDSTSLTIEYGQGWYLQATARAADSPEMWQATAGTVAGAPSGYAPIWSSFEVDSTTVIAYLAPADGARPLPAGTYSGTLELKINAGAGPDTATTPPATLTVTPAALGIDLKVGSDPSNPANAIVSARLTGDFADNYIPSSEPTAGLSPAGTWTISISDADGEVAHEFTANRSAGDDVLGVSSYWSDVPPGVYTARATFTLSGESAENFTVTQPSPLTFSPTPQPGATSTATAAPPAPPAAPDSGLTLPGWIPIAAGILTAGLIALAVVQIVRLRKAGLPDAEVRA
jgi:hypothetical protein